MSDDAQPETFGAFKGSFAYGSRTDLNFKFLSGLTDEAAARFFQELLWKLGDAFDDGRFDRLVQHVYEWQVRAYARVGDWTYEEGPFTPLPKSLSECRLALMASSGHFVEGKDPEPFGVEHMTQAEAAERILDFIRSEPTLSTVPVDTPREKLRVRHGGYDIRGAQADPNTVFPYEILRELAEEGRIGKLAPEAYSFVGACSQKRMLNDSGPHWAGMLRDKRVDVAVLVPV